MRCFTHHTSRKTLVPEAFIGSQSPTPPFGTSRRCPPFHASPSIPAPASNQNVSSCIPVIPALESFCIEAFLSLIAALSKQSVALNTNHSVSKTNNQIKASSVQQVALSCRNPLVPVERSAWFRRKLDNSYVQQLKQIAQCRRLMLLKLFLKRKFPSKLTA